MSALSLRFAMSTEKFKHLLKKKCVKDGCKGKNLFIWDQRSFFAHASMEDRHACITMCSECITKKMTTNPPVATRLSELVTPDTKVSSAAWQRVIDDAHEKLPVKKSDLFTNKWDLEERSKND